MPSPFPKLYHGRPDWPFRDDSHLFWIGLHTKFAFAHHPAESKHAQHSSSSFCKPRHLCEKLAGLITESKGGSILVTGYRGTGKTSLVNIALHEISENKEVRAKIAAEIPKAGQASSKNGEAARAQLERCTAVKSRLDALEANLGPLEKEFQRAESKLDETERVYAEWLSRSQWLHSRAEHAEQQIVADPDHSNVPALSDALVCKFPALRERDDAKDKRDQAHAKYLEVKREHEQLRTIRDTLRQTYDVLCQAPEETEIVQPVDQYLRVDVNLSSVTSAHEVLILTYEALQRRLREFKSDYSTRMAQMDLRGVSLHLQTIDSFERVLRELEKQYSDLRASTTTETRSQAQGFLRLGNRRSQESNSHPTQHTYNREALSRHQALLVDILKELRLVFYRDDRSAAPRFLHPIFVFDELDKLLPVDPEQPRHAEGTALDETPQARKLAQLQRIVAELKFFFSQSPSHQILIAGKDVDDSWSEDQNRGSGLFESIFVANLHVPSIFSCEFQPCSFGLGREIERNPFVPPTGKPKSGSQELNDYYETLAREIGIARNSWSFNTALLILPYLAEYETFQLLTRAAQRKTDDSDQIKHWTKIALERIPHSPEIYKGTVRPEGRVAAWKHAGAMSERSCRRLNTLILYLTYKGRGIPRKILREFYDTVLARSAAPGDDPGRHKLGPDTDPDTVRYLIAFPQHHLQKMNFYATIVATLDLSYPELRGLNDKGRVAIFHVLDYILKFYATGFSLRDLEHANFMTTREEFFPSRQLATLILRLLDGRLWRRKDPRSPEYRLLHNVVHDLGVMFLRYGPEQSELRHTQSDFREEIHRLQILLQDVQDTPPEQRTAPVHAQIRLARIYEMTGNHHEARLGYYRALRWLRADIATLEKNTHQIKSHVPGADFTRSFMMAPATYAIEVLLAVGRLHEETGEHPAAIQHYLEAERIYRYHDIHCNRYLALRAGANGMPDFAMDGDPSPADAESEPAGLPDALRDIRSYCPSWLEPTELCQTLIPASDPGFKQAHIGVCLAICPKRPVTALELFGQISGLGAGLHGIAAGLVETLNHTAIAYAKLWENVSSNLQLLRALVHLRQIGDEYGVVDQMFLIGQIMLRKRDFRAACLWYLAALCNIRTLHDHGDAVFAQTGAQWQTHAAATGTEAQILAALGDVWFATDGFAFLSPEEVASCQKEGLDAFIVNQNLHEQARKSTLKVIHTLRTYASEDRIEEYFHTQARYLFQAIGDSYNANDVYLRQLEVRAEIIRHSAALLDNALVAGVPPRRPMPNRRPLKKNTDFSTRGAISGVERESCSIGTLPSPR